MWVAPIVLMLLMPSQATAGASAPTTPQPAATPAATNPGPNFVGTPITTRQTVFSIPFQVPRAQDPAQTPAEVQLHVSVDRGRTWQLSGRAKPDQRAFAFRSPRDGEYWFAIRTLDASGKPRPGSDGPILRVIVDTAPPQLALQAVRGNEGQITARWKVVDPTLKPESILIQYRTGTEQTWQRVAVGKQSYDSATGTQNGEVTWWPNASKGTVQVRAEVVDAGGNPAVSHAQVDLDPAPAVADTKGATPTMSKTHEANRYQTAPGSPPIAGQANPSDGSTPTTTAGNQARPLVARSLRFELDYDLATAPAGLQRVEIWGTADNGNSWSQFAVDDDRRSPVRVSVPQPGMYGFRLVLRNAAGQGDLVPQRGDRPEVWVSVEPGAPQGRIRDLRPIP